MTYYERNLPHWHPPERAIFITWRLAGSLPLSLLTKLKNSREPGNQKFAAADAYLDAGASGAHWLGNPEVAAIVQACILKGAQELNMFDLFAYVIMPNHVHLLLEPKVPIQRITKGIKGASAHLTRQSTGNSPCPFWQDESFDHWVRKPAQGEKIIRYIENNPVKARLVSNASDWRWSSAFPVAQAFLPVRGLSAKET
jgi:putative DNA methylase